MPAPAVTVTDRTATRRSTEEFGIASRDPLEVLFEPASLSGTERLAHLIAASFGGNSPQFRRGKPYRASVLRPLYQLARQSGQADDASAGRRLAARNAAELGVLLHRRWGEEALALRPTLRRLQRLPDISLLSPDFSAWLTQQRGEGNDSWRVGAQWGLFADAYLADLAYYASVLERDGEEEEAAKITAADKALLLPGSSAQAAALREGGKGVLFAGAHAGAFAFGRRVMRNMFPDLLLLGAHGEAAQSETRVSANDPVRAMLQMVRHLRAPASVALIGADGPVASAMQAVQVCGRTINVALGAPHIVHHARCTNVFFLARWEGDRIAIEMRTDTQPEPGESLEAWTSRWMAAWARFLEDIIRGDPRNLRGLSGFWSQLGEG